MSLIIEVYKWDSQMAKHLKGRRRKNKDVKITIPTPFIFEDTKGYVARFTDFGPGGIKMELLRKAEESPHWDRIAAAMLPPNKIDAFLIWMAQTCGRPPMVIPEETLGVLQGLIAQASGTVRIPKADKKILQKTIAALETLYEEITISQRALSR